MPSGRALRQSPDFCSATRGRGGGHFKTEARVAYDAAALYISVQAFDPEPQRIVGIRTRRDEDSPSDWSQGRRRLVPRPPFGYEFAVNPAGVKQDSYWFNDTNNDQGWDAVWDVTVSRTERGWRAKFRIPFSQLRYQPRRRGHLRAGDHPARSAV